MKTKIRLALGGLAIVASGWLNLRAADSTASNGSGEEGRPTPAAKTPTTGHVLILENGRTLEGDIKREGSQYRVRRSIGETWVSADRVVRLCGSLEEAYQHLKKQANLRDPDERMRLAQWCQQHDLYDLALVEITAAVELRPHNAEYRRLLENLQRISADRGAAKGSSPLDTRSTGIDPRPSPPVDLTANSVSQFITKVQPVLMNTCANCHGPTHAGPFQLARETFEKVAGAEGGIFHSSGNGHSVRRPPIRAAPREWCAPESPDPAAASSGRCTRDPVASISRRGSRCAP